MVKSQSYTNTNLKWNGLVELRTTTSRWVGNFMGLTSRTLFGRNLLEFFGVTVQNRSAAHIQLVVWTHHKCWVAR